MHRAIRRTAQDYTGLHRAIHRTTQGYIGRYTGQHRAMHRAIQGYIGLHGATQDCTGLMTVTCTGVLEADMAVNPTMSLK